MSLVPMLTLFAVVAVLGWMTLSHRESFSPYVHFASEPPLPALPSVYNNYVVFPDSEPCARCLPPSYRTLDLPPPMPRRVDPTLNHASRQDGVSLGIQGKIF